MAKTKFDIKSLELPAPVARPLYVGVGATDLAVEYVREAVADVQKRFVGVQKDVQTRVADVQKNVKGFEFEPKTLRTQATARRAAVEARVAELQADAKAQAAKVQTVVTDNVATVTETYTELAKRGETAVKRFRGEVAGTLDDVADSVDSPKTPTAKKSAARKSVGKKPAAKKTTTKKAASSK